MSVADADRRDQLASRPAFIPSAEWPTNREIVQFALCQAVGGCPCAEPGAAGCVADTFVDEATAVLNGLAARHRLVSPTIERGG